MRRSVSILILGVLLAALATGCGASSGNGGEADHGQGGEAGTEGADAGCEGLSTEAAREECLHEKAAAQIPTADRLGYYVLATTAGLLRSNAVAAKRSQGTPSHASAALLRSAAGRVRTTRPHDRGLARVRAEEIELLRAALPGGFAAAAAGPALGRLDRVNAQLSGYVRHRQPAQEALVPD